MTQTDGELIRRIQHGDIDAFEVLVRRYERSVRGIAMAFGFDAHTRDDASQEIFVAAYRGLPQLNDPDRFAPWLMQIARRTCGKLANRARIAKVSAPLESWCAAPSESISERQRELLALIERLPANEQLVIRMRYFDGHSSQDIATATGRPLGTVTKQLSRAYERLRGWIL